MDNALSLWQIGIIALLAGVMIGALAYRWLAPSVKQAGKIKSELEQAQAELLSYKTSVNSHFNKTSELVKDLTQNYVKVYQHLAEGAQSLGDSSMLTSLLEQQQDKVLISVESKSPVADVNAVVDGEETLVVPQEPVINDVETDASSNAETQADSAEKDSDATKPSEPGNKVDKKEADADTQQSDSGSTEQDQQPAGSVKPSEDTIKAEKPAGEKAS